MTEIAILAAGCFWGIEEKFIKTDGVIETEVGYIGGTKENPTYEDVCQGNTNHAEAVKISFNSNIITFDSLLDIFFEIHNPKTLNRQGFDFPSEFDKDIGFRINE